MTLVYPAPVTPALDVVSPAREPFNLELSDVREFVKSLERVAKAIPRRSSVAILECVRLEVTGPHGSRLELTTTDMGMDIRETFELGASTSTGTALVGCKSLIAACKTLSGYVECELVGEDLATFEIRQGSSAIRLPAGDLEDYPVLPTPLTLAYESSGLELVVDRTGFLRAFESLANTYGRDETRPVLTGVHVTVTGNARLVLVATDSYRLAIDGVDSERTGDTTTPWTGCTIRGEELAKVCALAKKDKKGGPLVLELRCSAPRSSPAARGSGWQPYRDHAGDQRPVPDWKRLIPEDMPVRVTFDSATAIAALERIARLTTKNQPVRVTFPDGGEPMRLEADAFGVSLSETISGELGTEGFSFSAPIGFNPGFMVDAIRSIGEDRVTLWVISPSLRPGLFTSSDVQVLRYDQIDDSRLVLLMPVKLTG